MEDLTARLNALLRKWALKIIYDVQREWGNHPTPGEAHISFVSNMLAGEVTATLIASGQKAWILEYGKGTLMDLSNPYLAEYQSNPNYNRYRKFNEVAGRGPGVYHDLDGNEFTSSGKAVGVNLETVAFVTGKDEFLPSEPLHLIFYSILENRQLILDDIAETFALYTVELFVTAFPKEITI
jgi:hypothetical protein